MVRPSPITITARALEHLCKIATVDKPHVLIGVKGGGCNGLRYYVKATDTIDPADETLQFASLNVAVCRKSLLHILGTTIDWTEDVMGSRLEFINPNATSKCGCGDTFSV